MVFIMSQLVDNQPVLAQREKSQRLLVSLLPVLSQLLFVKLNET